MHMCRNQHVKCVFHSDRYGGLSVQKLFPYSFAEEKPSKLLVQHGVFGISSCKLPCIQMKNLEASVQRYYREVDWQACAQI